jgi:hypothetical protein
VALLVADGHQFNSSNDIQVLKHGHVGSRNKEGKTTIKDLAHVM